MPPNGTYSITAEDISFSYLDYYYLDKETPQQKGK